MKLTRTQIGIGLLTTAALMPICGILFHPWIVHWLVNFAPEGVVRDWETTSDLVIAFFIFAPFGLGAVGVSILTSRYL